MIWRYKNLISKIFQLYFFIKVLYGVLCSKLISDHHNWLSILTVLIKICISITLIVGNRDHNQSDCFRCSLPCCSLLRFLQNYSLQKWWNFIRRKHLWWWMFSSFLWWWIFSSLGTTKLLISRLSFEKKKVKFH